MKHCIAVGLAVVVSTFLTGVQAANTFSLSATNLVFGPELSTNSVALSVSPAGTAWTATTTAGWLSLGASSGTGSTHLAFILAANSGATRTGTVSVAGQTLTVVQAGAAYTAAGMLVLSAPSAFANSRDVAIATNGDVCFVDDYSGKVCRWNRTSNTVSTLSSGFNTPGGLCVDSANNLYIADTGNNAVKRWDAGSGAVSTAVTNVASPSDVALDSAGNLYVLDTHNHALWKQPAGSGSLALLLNSGSLTTPNTLALDSLGNLYIADQAYPSLRSYNLATAVMTTWAGLAGVARGVAVDAGGNACVSLPSFRSIYRYNAANGALSKLVDGVQSVAGLAFDAAGNLVIGNTSQSGQMEILPRAFVNTNALTPGFGAADLSLPAVVSANTSFSGLFAPSSDQAWLTLTGVTNGAVSFHLAQNTNAGFDPREARISFLGLTTIVRQAAPLPLPPQGLAIAGQTEGPAAGLHSVTLAEPPGTNWVATANAPWLHVTPASGTGSTNVIYSFDANTGATRSGTLTIAGNTFTVTQAGAGCVAASALTTLVSSGLAGPNGLAVDPSGNVYIADTTNNAVKMWSPATGTVTTLVASGLSYPVGVAVDTGSNVYIADRGNGAIKVLVRGASSLTTLYSGLNRPTGIAVDSLRNVYFSDQSASRVYKWSQTNGAVSTLISTGLSSPSGIAVDLSGNVYVVNASGATLKMWNSASGLLTTVVSSGIGSPFALAADGAGDLYVTDSSTKSVKRYSAANRTLSTAVSAGLQAPDGLALDSSGTLYVSDMNSNTVAAFPRAFINTNAVYEYADAGTDQLSGVVLPASQNLSGPFFPGTNQAWLSVASAGNGGVGLRFTMNTNAASRTATLSVLGQGIPIIQGSTNFSLSATNLVFGPESSPGSVLVTAHPSTAAWSASSAADWIHLNATAGPGSGVLGFALDANTGTARTGTVMVAGLTLTIVQSPAVYTLSATNLVFGPEASTNSATLTVSPTNAPWSAASAANWIHLLNPGGTGSTNLGFTLDANTGNTRTGLVAAAGQSLTVVQAGAHFISAGLVILNSVKGYASLQDVAADSKGNACFVDAATGAVYRWNHADESITMLCTNLNGPTGLCIDSADNLYIADTHNNAVKRWDASSGAMSSAIPYVFNPGDVALDGAGNLYVLDTYDYEFWKQPAGGGSLALLLDVGNLMAPNSMALDRLGNLYIADLIHSSLWSYNLATATLATRATLSSTPQGTAVDACGNVCVSLPDSSSIYRYNAVNGALSKLADGVQNPGGMAFDAAGNLFITEANSPTPLIVLPRAFVDSSSVLMTSEGGNASLPAVLPATVNLSGSFAPSSSDPTWLTITGVTNGAVSFSVSPNTNASAVYRQARITVLGRSIAVNQMPAAFATAGLAVSGRSVGSAAGADSVVLALPPGSNWVATANDSWLHVSTASGTGSGTVVYSFDANTNAIRRGTLTIASNTFSVAQAGVSYLPSQGAAPMVSNGVGGLCGLAVDPAGNVYIADTTNNAIRVWNIASNSLTTLAFSDLNQPSGIAIDAWTNLYVADSSNGMVKRRVAGNPGFTPLVSGLKRPVGVATDGAGNVYFTDAGTATVQKWSAASGTVSTLIASGLSNPSGLAADWSGNLYIADAGSYTLKKWTAATSTLAPLISGFASMGGVAADASGDVYAADPVAGTVRKYCAVSNSVSTAALPGVKQPCALALNSAGCLFLSELASNSILQSPRVFLDVTPVMREADPDSATIFNRVLPDSQYFTPAFLPTASAPWVSVLYFNGNNVGISLDANTGAASRTATLNLLGRQIPIIQDPAELAVGTTNLLVGPLAGTNSVCLSVRPRGRAWTASANASWLHLSATAGTGATNVLFTMDANPGATRTGTLTLGDATVTVTQAGASYTAVVGVQTIFNYEEQDWLGSVAVAADGTIYFAEYGPGMLDVWNSTTHDYRYLTGVEFFYPAGLAVDASNNVYIADQGHNAIKRWNAADGSLTTVMDSGLNIPHDVALDQRHNLYIANAYSCEIKRFSLRDGSMATLATYGAEGFFIPWSLAVDVEGNVYYIAGYNSDQINKWTHATGATSTLLTGLTGARYVNVDGSGNVYVAADGVGGVVKLDATTGTLTRIFNVGQVFGSAVDLDGNVYLTKPDTAALYELPHAFVDATPKTERAAAGSDTLPPILPGSPRLFTAFPPASDQDWLKITGVTSGVISYSFATNNTGLARTAHITVLDHTVAVTQLPIMADKGPQLTTPTLLSNNTVLRFTLTNATPGATYSVLTSTNLAAPLSNWSLLLLSTNTPAGVLEILDTNRLDAQRFYRVRSP